MPLPVTALSAMMTSSRWNDSDVFFCITELSKSIWDTNTGELAGRSWRSGEQFTHPFQRSVQVNIQLEDIKVVWCLFCCEVVTIIDFWGSLWSFQVASGAAVSSYYSHTRHLLNGLWSLSTVSVGFPAVRNKALEHLGVLICITRVGCGSDYHSSILGKNAR